MPERQTTLSYAEGTAKEPAAGIKHSYKAESAGWLCRRGEAGILCSCSLLSLFLPFSYHLSFETKTRSRYPKRSEGHSLFTPNASWTQHRDQLSLSH